MLPTLAQLQTDRIYGPNPRPKARCFRVRQAEHAGPVRCDDRRLEAHISSSILAPLFVSMRASPPNRYFKLTEGNHEETRERSRYRNARRQRGRQRSRRPMRIPMVLIDFFVLGQFDVFKGKVAFKSSFDALMNDLSHPGFAPCTNLEVRSVHVLDENQTVFGTMGLFMPPL